VFNTLSQGDYFIKGLLSLAVVQKDEGEEACQFFSMAKAA
jgi:hypothetical protein